MVSFRAEMTSLPLRLLLHLFDIKAGIPGALPINDASSWENDILVKHLPIRRNNVHSVTYIKSVTAWHSGVIFAHNYMKYRNAIVPVPEMPFFPQVSTFKRIKYAYYLFSIKWTGLLHLIDSVSPGHIVTLYHVEVDIPEKITRISVPMQ